MVKTQKLGLVETFVVDVIFERLRMAILHRLAGCDVMPIDAGLAAPP
jgi:hypothetical protein